MSQSRREFLEQSMLAAVAALGVGSSRGTNGRLQAAEKVTKSPNERLSVAVLGVNSRGTYHIRELLRLPDCDIVAIVDPDEAVGMTKGVQPVEQESGKRPAFYRDMRTVFDDKSIDIITIATPNHWHSLAAIWAMQSGKDVYVEKPVSHNIAEGRRAVQAAQQYRRICQTGTQCRSMTGTSGGIDYIKAGKIGEVTMARGLCYKRRKSIGPAGHYDVPSSVDYSLWLGPAPEKPLTRKQFHYDWHWQWDYGAGDLGNQGVHQMDIARWGLGVDHPQSVSSYGGRLGYTDAGETANTQISQLDFGDQQIVFEVRGLESELYKGVRVGVIFQGSDGYVVLDGYDHGAAFDPQGKMVAEFKGGETYDHFVNFRDAVRQGNPDILNSDILEGHISAAMCHACNISYRLGSEMDMPEVAQHLRGDAEAKETFSRLTGHLKANGVNTDRVQLQFGPKLTFDGSKERFTGQKADEANSMLSREYRAPFVVPGETELATTATR